MRRSNATLRLIGTALSCAAVVAIFLGAATAEEPMAPAVSSLDDGIVRPTSIEPLAVDGAAAYGSYGGYGAYSAYDEYQGPINKPVNWVAGPYLKAGPTGILGEGILDDPDVGWMVSGGYRQPLGPELGGDRVFFDLGGSYMSAYGETVRSTPGFLVETNILGDVVNSEIIDDAFLTTLKEVKRASAHAALGCYWGDPCDRPGEDPQVRVATRFGGRFGHIRGRFDLDGQLIAPGANETITPIYGKTDTFGGLFLGAEAVFLHRQYDFGSVQWTVDGELANDWVEFHHFESSSLGTASVMFGFMLSR